MPRFGFTTVIGLAVLLVAGPAAAQQSAELIKKIEDETAMRFDPAAADAKAKAAEAAELRAKGQEAAAQKAAQEGLKLLGK